MKRIRKITAVLLAMALILTGGLSLAPVGTAQAEELAWAGWDGNQPPGKGGWKWGFPELWWYGKAQAFAYGAELNYRADDATAFWVEGKALPGSSESGFGAYAEWGTPLDAGYIYKFTVRISDPDAGFPDFITVNDSLVWNKSEGYANAANKEVEFTYVPASDKEVARIYFIKTLDPQDTTNWYSLHPTNEGIFHDRNFISRRAAWSDARPDYDIFQLPAETVYAGVDPHMAAAYNYDNYGLGVDYDGYTLPALPYPIDDVKVMERWLPAIEGGNYYAYPQTDVATYQPGGSDINFELWSDSVKAAGTKAIALTPVLDRIYTEKNVTVPGTYKFFHLSSILAGSASLNKGVEMTLDERIEKLNLMTETVASLAHRWLEKVPDGTVYLFEVESSANYGLYKNGITESNIGLFPGYEELTAGGANAWNLAFDFIQTNFFDAISQSTKLSDEDRSKLRTMANFDRAAFQGAYALHAGAEVVLHKNIHRQSINVVAANSRGAADSYDKEYGYDFDNWDRQYAFSYTPEEIMHSLKTYFHSGADYIMDEINTFDTAAGKVNTWGKTWLEFWHYAKTHPKLGDQQVNIGIMHGLGDEWNRVGGQSAAWESGPWLPKAEINASLALPQVPQKWAKAKKAQNAKGSYKTADTYFQDNNLLNLVFANMGGAYRTNMDRTATGTPYGPVNFIPWDTPAGKLDQYDALMYFGRGVGMTQQELDNLNQYVQSGGTLVMAAGQLRGEDHQFIAPEFLGVGLGEQREMEQLPYTLLTAPQSGWEILSSLSNGDPEAVKVQYGQGTLVLFSGEWLTYWNDEGPAQLLQPILDDAKWLEFGKPNDRIEYMVQKKQDTWVFPIFNHGRGYYPSMNGEDFGVYTDTVSVDLAMLGLTGQEVEVYKAEYDRQYDPDTTLPVTLAPVPFQVQGEQLSFDVAVDEMDEIVIGPKATVKQEYFGLVSYSPVAGVSLEQDTAALHPEDTLQLMATVVSDNPGNAVMDWSSDDESVATVDSNGLVTAHDLGSTVIRVRVADPISNTVYSAEASVTVTPKLDYIVNDSFNQDTVGAEPAGWTVATSGGTGNTFTVVEESIGENYVTMHREDNLTATGYVWTRPVSTEGITGKVTVEAKLKFPNATKDRMLVINNTDGESIVQLKINYQGKLVVHNGSGYVDTGLTYIGGNWLSLTIELDTTDHSYVLVLNGNPSASLDLLSDGPMNVSELQFKLLAKQKDEIDFDDVRVGMEAVPVDAVSLDQTSAAMVTGETLQLMKQVSPSEAAGRSLNVNWSTSDADVVEVDANGLVTAVGEGAATILLTVADELYGTAFTAEFAVSVEPAQQTNVQDDFNSELSDSVPAGWTVTEAAAGSNALVFEEVQGSGEKWLRMNKVNTTAAALEVMKEFEPLSGRVVLKTSVQAPVANKTRFVLVRNSEGQTVLDTRLGYDGKVRVVDGTASPVEIGLTYQANTWYELKYDLNTGTGEYDFYVNNTKVGSYQAVPQASYDPASIAFRMQNAYADTLDIDNMLASTLETPIAGIGLDLEDATMYPDQTLQLTATVLPYPVTGLPLNWTSSDDSIAAVDADGVVTALAAGEADITVRVTDPVTQSEYSASASIAVLQPQLTGVSLNSTTAELESDESLQLSAFAIPEAAAGDFLSFRWVSDDAEVAAVDEHGWVTATGIGSTVVHVIMTDTRDQSQFAAECAVTVVEAPEPEMEIRDTFDADQAGVAPAGWLITSGSPDNTVTVAEDVAGSGQRYAAMNKGSNTAAAFTADRFVGGDAGLGGKVVLQTKVRFPNATKSRFIQVNNSAGETIVKLGATYDGYFKVFYESISTATSTNVPYTGNSWYELRVELDTDTGYYDLLIDGTKAGTYPVLPSGTLHVGSLQFRLHNASPDEIHFDDVVIESLEEPEPAAPLATLSGSDEVKAGQSFRLNYGLENVIDSVSSSVYAQYIVLNYDPNLVEFVSAVSMKEGVALLETVAEADGEVTLIVASQGPDYAISGEGDVLGLNWKAKPISQSIPATVSIVRATLANGFGDETEAGGAVHHLSIVITTVPGDLNRDGQISIGDLAIVAANYGKTSGDAEWDSVKSADLDGDNEIGIMDLVEVAREIMLKP